MPKPTTITETTSTSQETKTETNDSPVKQALQQIEKIKDALKGVLSDLAGVFTSLKQAEKEKKSLGQGNRNSCGKSSVRSKA